MLSSEFGKQIHPLKACILGQAKEVFIEKIPSFVFSYGIILSTNYYALCFLSYVHFFLMLQWWVQGIWQCPVSLVQLTYFYLPCIGFLFLINLSTFFIILSAFQQDFLCPLFLWYKQQVHAQFFFGNPLLNSRQVDTFYPLALLHQSFTPKLIQNEETSHFLLNYENVTKCLIHEVEVQWSLVAECPL